LLEARALDAANLIHMNDNCHNRKKNIMNCKESISLIYDIWRTGHYDQSTIEACQQARLKDLVRFVRDRSPFYKEIYKDISGVQHLPYVTKQELMANFDSWVTDKTVNRRDIEAFVKNKHLIGSQYLGRYTIMTTSGITGEQGIFIHDNDALTVYAVLGIVRDSLGVLTPGCSYGILKRGGRVAVVVSTGGHFASEVATEFSRRLSPLLSKRIRTFSVLMPLPRLVQELNDFQPAILFGYPTAFLLLAFEQMAGRLNIHPVKVVTGGEWLAPGTRKQIERTFKCYVSDVYAATEFPGIAFDCGHDWLHVNADWVILEPVDEVYQPVPPGKSSYTVLLTNLVNRVQPIIRYDLGDSITVNPDPCPCGSPLPSIRVEGRRDAILLLQTPSGRKIPLLPMALATVIEETPGIQRFQVVQTAPATLRIRLEVINNADDKKIWQTVAHRLRDYLSSQGLSSITLERATEPPMQDKVSGKFRQIWAEI
jgi:phenylacetate-CoA ligase